MRKAFIVASFELIHFDHWDVLVSAFVSMRSDFLREGRILQRFELQRNSSGETPAPSRAPLSPGIPGTRPSGKPVQVSIIITGFWADTPCFPARSASVSPRKIPSESGRSSRGISHLWNLTQNKSGELPVWTGVAPRPGSRRWEFHHRGLEAD